MYDHSDYHMDMQNAENDLAARFYPGRSVRYVPYHAEGDAGHPDCANGVVSSVRDTAIFVRFGIGPTAQRCNEDQLR